MMHLTGQCKYLSPTMRRWRRMLSRRQSWHITMQLGKWSTNYMALNDVRTHFNTNEAYYKRQLSVYNCGTHDCGANRGYFHMWHEATASRGPAEIASRLWHWLQSIQYTYRKKHFEWLGCPLTLLWGSEQEYCHCRFWGSCCPGNGSPMYWSRINSQQPFFPSLWWFPCRWKGKTYDKDG